MTAARLPQPGAPALWPTPLRPGDRIAVVAPCHPVDAAGLDAGLAAIRRWGFDPVVMPHVHDRWRHLAGTDEARLADLQDAFDDAGYRAVWVVRGGSGLSRIVDRLDWTAVGADPVPIIGFSDATVLLHAAWRALRLVTVHGQFAGRAHLVERVAPDAAAHLVQLLTGDLDVGPFPQLAGEPAATIVHGGRAEGRLLGGNLSTLATSIGTPWQVDLDGAVLLVEEVGEEPYAIDRSLTQLRTSGSLDGVAAVLVGRPRNCEPRVGVTGSADEVFAERLGDLGVPVLGDLPVGHVDRHLALPHGARVAVDADQRLVTLIERPSGG